MSLLTHCYCCTIVTVATLQWCDNSVTNRSECGTVATLNYLATVVILHLVRIADSSIFAITDTGKALTMVLIANARYALHYRLTLRGTSLIIAFDYANDNREIEGI